VLRGEQQAGFTLSGYLPDLPVVIDPTLSWNTFLGGGSYDYGHGIAVDTSGNVYVTGYSYATWGTTPVRPYGGGGDAFVAKVATAPTVTVDEAATQSDPTNVAAIQFTVTFDEDVTGLAMSDFVATNGSVTSLSGSGSICTVTVSATSDGTVSLSLPADSAEDGAGNGNTASTSTDNSVTYDATAPTVTLTYAPAGSYRSGDVVTITATFSEAVADSPLPQISISGAVTLAPTETTRVTDTVYDYIYAVAFGGGKAYVAISAATDLAGNPIVGTPTSGGSFFVDYPQLYNPEEESWWVRAEVCGGNGSVSPAGQLVGYDSPADIEITPDPGYYLVSILDNGVPRAVSDPYRVEHVTERHQVVVTFAPYQEPLPTGFPDVPATHPYYTAIGDLASRGVLAGLADGSFGPEVPLTRQQFAKLITLTLGLEPSASELCPFGDVQTGLDEGDPLYPQAYVALCARLGITKGTTLTTFDPYGNLSRQHLLSMISRAAALPEPPPSYVPPFLSAQFWAFEHHQNARKAAYAGLLEGIEGLDLSYDVLSWARRVYVRTVLRSRPRERAISRVPSPTHQERSGIVSQGRPVVAHAYVASSAGSTFKASCSRGAFRSGDFPSPGPNLLQAPARPAARSPRPIRSRTAPRTRSGRRLHPPRTGARRHASRGCA